MQRRVFSREFKITEYAASPVNAGRPQLAANFERDSGISWGCCMGGYGSGRRGWRVSDDGTGALVLDVDRLVTPVLRQLRREGQWPPRCGETAQVSGQILTWTRTNHGSLLAEVMLDVRLCANTRAAWLRDDIRHLTRDTGPQDYAVLLEPTPGTLGGQRWWFLCPATGRRVRKLVLPNGGQQFLSRGPGAYQLAYASQAENRIARAHRRAYVVRKRLGATGEAARWGFPPRPKGMHHATYLQQVGD
jgi:hypothetical protein